MTSVMRTGIASVLFLAAVSGCQKTGPGGASPSASPTGSAGTVTVAELSKIGLAFQSYEDSFRKGPAAAADLQPFLKDMQVERDAYQKLSQGEVVFLWGASMKKMPKGPSATAVAYAKDVPTQGGLVLFGSSEVRTLSAQDFAKAPKAAERN